MITSIMRVGINKHKEEDSKMRILANYGYRTNGDTYSVTFETMGDVPKENADATVDELFRLAKAAIERQINPDSDPLEFPPACPEHGRGKEKNGVTIPQPNKKQAGIGNGNGSASHAANGKPQIKDPDAPASGKQKSLIIRLAKERGQFIQGLNNFTMQGASEKIDELMAVTV